MSQSPVPRTGSEIAQLRLHNQRLSNPTFQDPRQVVHWMGAMQAQDYSGAKWAIAQRARDIRDADVDRALAEGSILRTHLLRPTWHFVTPADIHWMLKLTAPRVHTANSTMYNRLELDKRIFRRSQDAIAAALAGGRQLIRTELKAVLHRAGIEAEGERLSYLMMHAELDGVICSGGRLGNQFSYALLEERAPKRETIDREHALAELTARYFTSRGPAGLKDFVWWSGLTVAEARAGIELAGDRLTELVAEDQTYWRSHGSRIRVPKSESALLLSTYDEYWMGYKSRGVAIDSEHAGRIIRGETFTAVVLLSGRAVGTWNRTLNSSSVEVVLELFGPLAKDGQHAIAREAERFGKFLGLSVRMA